MLIPLVVEHTMAPACGQSSIFVNCPAQSEEKLINGPFLELFTSQHFTSPLLAPVHILLISSCRRAFTSEPMCGSSCFQTAGVSKPHPSMAIFDTAMTSFETVAQKCGL